MLHPSLNVYALKQANTKTVIAGPHTVKDLGGKWNRWFFITGVEKHPPPATRTETRHPPGKGREFKSVLNISIRGVMLSLRDGDNDGGRLTELERQQIGPGDLFF